jgi:uncharacterized protein (TIGR02598 family)
MNALFASRFRRPRAFSLPETSMAVAIAALGIISLMGLMPQGLETSRKTGNLTAESRIMQSIVSDLESSDWTLLSGVDNSTRTFDEQGVRLSSADTAQTAYIAKINFGPSYVPGSITTTGTGEPYMQRLIVKIASSNNPAYNFPSSDSGRYKTTSFLLTKIQ